MPRALPCLLLVVACHPTATAPAAGPEPFPARAPSRPDPPSAPLAPSTEIPDGRAQLLLDGPVSGCQRFSVLATDRIGTRWLVLRVDADRLKLEPGTHELAIDGRFVALEVSVYAAPTGPIVCSDVPPRPVERRQRWTAVAGTVKLSWSDEGKRGERFPVDVELVDIDLVEDAGAKQRIATTMKGVEVGWTPG